MSKAEKNEKRYTADEIQWMHFAAVLVGRTLDDLEQTLDDKRGILGKRLTDALGDLFGWENEDEVQKYELMIFNAEREDAWISEDLFYFVQASEITVELRFPARLAWKALIGSLIMSNQEEAEDWFSLAPNRSNWQMLKESQSFTGNTIETCYRLLELLVRGVPESPGKVKRIEIQKLLDACKQGDTQAAYRLEAMAWEAENANLWRYAMALADGKNYLARMFEDRILF